MRVCKGSMAGYIASVLFGVLVISSSASATRLSLSAETFRVRFATVEFMGGVVGANSRCPLTLEGSFHARTLSKVAGLLMGYVTRATLGSCQGGLLIVLSETLPWHIQYRSFTGSLPFILELNTYIVGMALLVRGEIFEAECLIRSSAAEPVLGSYMREITGTNLVTELLRGEISSGCGTSRLTGTATTITALSGASIRLTLI